jgi:hypothetical protein
MPPPKRLAPKQPEPEPSRRELSRSETGDESLYPESYHKKGKGKEKGKDKGKGEGKEKGKDKGKEKGKEKKPTTWWSSYDWQGYWSGPRSWNESEHSGNHLEKSPGSVTKPTSWQRKEDRKAKDLYLYDTQGEHEKDYSGPLGPILSTASVSVEARLRRENSPGYKLRQERRAKFKAIKPDIEETRQRYEGGRKRTRPETMFLSRWPCEVRDLGFVQLVDALNDQGIETLKEIRELRSSGCEFVVEMIPPPAEDAFEDWESCEVGHKQMRRKRPQHPTMP